MKRSEALKKQCRVAGFVIAPLPSQSPVLTKDSVAPRSLPTFLTCGAEICCHWIEEGDPNAPDEARSGRCGVGGA